MSSTGGSGIPRRPFGKTGEAVSLLCVGGAHIGLPGEEIGIRIIHTCIDAGAMGAIPRSSVKL
jgi:hypothetical protein